MLIKEFKDISKLSQEEFESYMRRHYFFKPDCFSQVEKLENKLNSLVKIIDDKNKEIEIGNEKIIELEKELDILKLDFKNYISEKSSDIELMYESYVFGDRLPQMKLLYNFLKEHKIYKQPWGFFCQIFQHKKRLPFMLIVPREFTNADIGLILYKFGEFLNLTPSEAIMYFHRFVIIVTRKLAGHNMSTFKKFVSPYDKSVSNKPKMYNEIIELFDKMNI